MLRLAALALCPLVAACSSSDPADSTPAPDPTSDAQVIPEPDPVAVDPSERPEGFDWDMSSVEFTLGPGEERYICTTMTLDEATNFHRWKIGDYQTVHHMFLAHDIGVEPESDVFECPELFRPTWLPLFTTGAGYVTLDLPEATAFTTEAGSRLVMQLHLLNTSSNEVTEQVQVFAQTITDEERISTANLYAFGTTVIDIPPLSNHDIVHECVMDRSMDAFVVMPHMHQLGREIIFETGMDEASMEVAWRGDWDFDNQQLVPANIALREGMHTRLTCRYENPHDEVINYGESTMDEMCFFSVFAKDIGAMSGCVDLTNLDLSQFAQ